MAVRFDCFWCNKRLFRPTAAHRKTHTQTHIHAHNHTGAPHGAHIPPVAKRTPTRRWENHTDQLLWLPDTNWASENRFGTAVAVSVRRVARMLMLPRQWCQKSCGRFMVISSGGMFSCGQFLENKVFALLVFLIKSLIFKYYFLFTNLFTILI